MRPRIAVAAWIGAGNLGDELLLRVTLMELDRVQLEPLVLSRDPAETTRIHGGVRSVSHLAANRWVLDSDGLVFGGGGLVQDRTSRLSPVYQASRPALANLRHKPMIAIGLGAEPLRFPLSRALFRRSLAPALTVQARDEPSARILLGLGLDVEPTAADLVWLLSKPTVEVLDRLVVNLPPPVGPGGWRPASFHASDRTRRSIASSAWASALDEISKATGLEVHMVALDRDRDHAQHLAVAERMGQSVECHRPSLDAVSALMASGAVVVAGRYHACLLAAASGRPTIALGYAPKVRSLADVLPGLVEAHPYEGDVPSGLVRAVEQAASTSCPDPSVTEPLRLRASTVRQAFERLAISVRLGQ